MTYIFVHGLGQNPSSWQKTIDYLEINSSEIAFPDLFSLLNTDELTYQNLYQSFFDYCERFDGPIQLCGLSLGAILAFNYALDRPEKVSSLILIGAQYKMPRVLLSIQNGVFHILPQSIFRKMGLPKKNVIQLTKSMKNLDFSQNISDISCKTLVLYGEKDKMNRKAAEELSNKIADAKLEIIKMAGHETNSDNPKELAGKINDFWK